MITVRHGDSWDLCGAVVHVTLRRGEFDVVVCSDARAVYGAHVIRRVDGESWVILPLRYVRVWPRGVEQLMAVSSPVGDGCSPGDQVLLTNAPAEVSLQLESL